MPTTNAPDLPANVAVFDLAAIAEWLGIRLASVHTYHKDATRRRREGTSRPGDLPAPHTLIGGHPAWTREQLLAWRKRRPGAGARTDLAGHQLANAAHTALAHLLAIQDYATVADAVVAAASALGPLDRGGVAAVARAAARLVEAAELARIARTPTT